MAVTIRPHRGGYAESMAQQREVDNSLEAVAKAIGATKYHLRVEHYGRDERNGWDTHIILINGEPWGFASGPVKDGNAITP